MFKKSLILKHSVHRQWNLPKGFDTGIKVYNSLENNKKSLVPLIVKNPRNITWYTCGPTVYDSSHLGHARNFVSLDIIRRVVQDYFGYSVNTVMNITDIDDKLILRAKENNQQSVLQLAKHFENDFKNDMLALNVRPPLLYTKVTEFIPEIVDCIQKIIDNGFGYEANGSVYFNSANMLKQSTHARLMPSRLDGEHDGDDNDINVNNNETSEKKSRKDFALWKKTEANDPNAWDSPFGRGRPGWHIECSAMAMQTLGPDLDIHCGGSDLKFPHNENEILQCEALHNIATKEYELHQWPNYFLHVGHLKVKGRKMSKSLKNFISIKEFLEHSDADVFRWFCLLHRWDKSVEWQDDRQVDAKHYQQRFSNFITTLNDYIENNSENKNSDESGRWQAEEMKLQQNFMQLQTSIFNHLSNNFDTPKVIDSMNSFISECHRYLKSNNKSCVIDLLREIIQFYSNLLSRFGLKQFESNNSELLSNNTSSSSYSDVNLQALKTVRDDIRTVAKQLEQSSDKTKLFEISDKIRDVLNEIGASIQDKK